MRPTDILKDEHRIISAVLYCLEQMTDAAVQSGRLEPQPARDAVGFLRQFADRYHHRKEEDILFPAIDAKGLFPGCGLIPEHEEGRFHVRGMEAAIDEAAAGNRDALQSFVGHARAYVEMLRAHMDKEDHCLVNREGRAFTDAEMDELVGRFRQIESEESGSGALADSLRLAADLERRYGRPPA